MRIATYTRISTDEDHQPYSLDAQATRLGSYADSQEGWAIVRRESDQKSGATLDRPGLQKLLREGEAGRFDLLLVYKVDRVARSVRGLAQIIERLDEANVLFRSATEPFDTASPAGRMMVQMLGVFAEFERATIVERVIAGMERKAARGEWTAGQVPYGYTKHPRLHFLVPDPAEIPVVRIIFERYADRLEGAQTIARWLAERGYRTRRGVPFNPKAVLTILRNRVYIGEIFFRGTYYPGPHEPLIDLSLFDRTQQILAERGDDLTLRRTNASDFPLTGLLRCDHCNRRHIGESARGRRRTYHYYTCFSRLRYGRNTCDADRISAPALEAAVLDQLAGLLQQTDLVTDAIRAAAAELDAGPPSLGGGAQATRRRDRENRRSARTLLPCVRARHDARAAVRPAHRRTQPPAHRPQGST
jgi:site-specific DNA recombinase